jgi:RNA polymerase-binding transcription factor DksA
MTVTERDLLSRLQDEKARLESIREEILSEHGEGSEASKLGELSTFDQHQADVGSEVFEREKDLSIVQQVEDQIGEVEAAMARVGNGSYGKCERCGKPIAEDRLEAIPWARLCVEDQAAGERLGGAAP